MRYVLLTFILLLAACSGEPEETTDATADNRAGDLVSDQPQPDLTLPDALPDIVPDADKDAAVEIAGEVSSMPPEKCNEQVSPWGVSALFVDKTLQYKLDHTQLDVLGNRLASADLDGDGYSDLIVHKGGSHNRDDPANGVFNRRVLMNRPAGGVRTFEDFTVESNYGIIPDTEELGRSAQFAIFADADNDGDVDLFSATFCDRNSENKVPDRSVILLNNGDGVFELAPASEVSPEDEWSTSSAAFLDYDLDGNIDLWVGNWYYQYGYLQGMQDALFKGNGDGTFVDVTVEAGLQTTETGWDEGTNHRPTFGVASCDADGDGDMDLLSSSYGRQLNMLWLNNGDGTFSDVSHATGFASDDNLDFSDNQFYACFCHKFGGSCDPMPPKPVIVCENNYWSDNDFEPWRNGGNTFTTLCADLDNDLDPDLYNAEIVHWHIGQSSDPSQLLLNEEAPNTCGFVYSRPGREATGLFRPRVGSWNEGDIYAAVFDADGDGITDIFQPSSDYPDTHGWLFRGIGGGLFENVDDAHVSGLSLQRIGGIALADFDLDGDIDSVVAFSTMRCDANCEFDKPVVRMFANTLDDRANWTSVKLKGKGGPGGSNGAGIGAKVYVTTGETVQVKEISGGYGHMGLHNTLNAHFGLGTSCRIDKMEIHWPNQAQTVSLFEDVPANYFLVVHEDTGELEFLEP